MTKKAVIGALSVFLALAPAGISAEETGPTAVLLVPLGKASATEVAAVQNALMRTYRVEVRVAPRRALPKETYYPPGHRYRAEHLLTWLAKIRGGDKVFGVAHVDISTTARGHKDWGVVGLGQLGNRAAIVSDHRLKGDRVSLGDVAIHELAHTFGRPHCPTVGCTMHDKEGHVAIGHTHTFLCARCRTALAPWLR